MKKLITFTSAILASAFLFFGCYDPIFQSIRAEVALEDADISGFINSMVPFTVEKDGDEVDLLFLQNGRIYYKNSTNKAHGSWIKDNSEGLPPSISYEYYQNEFKGYNFSKLASDNENLYALCYKPEFNDDKNRNVPTDVKFYCYNKTEQKWQKHAEINALINTYIESLDKDNFMMDASIHLFDNNETEFAGSGEERHLKTSSNRRAYIRIGGGRPYETGETSNKEYGANGNAGILLLNGNSAPTPIAEDTNGAGLYTLSAVNNGSDDIFLNYLVARKSVNNPAYTYVGIGNTLYTFETANIDQTIDVIDGSSEKTMLRINASEQGKSYWDDTSKTIKKTVSLGAITIKDIEIPAAYIKSTSGCEGNILSIAETAESILMGTYEYGIYRVLTSAGVPEEKTTDFTTNGDDIMGKPYIIRMLYIVDTTKNESDATIYSSMQFRYTQSNAGTNYSNVGLWSYYPKRANWNRE